MTRGGLITFGWICFLLSGCATHVDRLNEVRSDYFTGQADAALAKIEKYEHKHPKESEVFKLDHAVVLLSQGKAREAEKLLREMRDRLDYLEQKDAKEIALSMLTDDQRLSYGGEDYEKVMIRAFLALASLLGDGQDAGAYALQVTAKQQQIIDAGREPDGKNPKQDYQHVAFGAYLQGLLREETQANYDDAARAIEQVCHWEPGFASGRKDLERVKQGHHSAKGNGVLYVFALVGEGPHKVESLEIPTTAGLLIADRILSSQTHYSLPPTVAPIKVPKVVVPDNDIRSVRVAVDGQAQGETETVTDIGRLAVQQCEALAAQTLGRAIARRVVKKGVVYGAKEVAKANELSSLAFDVAGVVWEATEGADTRCWGLLPEKIQVLRIELPAGKHQILLQPTRPPGSVAPTPQTSAPVDIVDGRNSYLLVNFPSTRLVGQVVTNQQL